MPTRKTRATSRARVDYFPAFEPFNIIELNSV